MFIDDTEDDSHFCRSEFCRQSTDLDVVTRLEFKSALARNARFEFRRVF